MDAQHIAQVAYEADRAYSGGKIAWDEVPDDEKDALLGHVGFQLECLNTGSPASPYQTHAASGSSVLFSELTPEDVMRYRLLGAVVATLYEAQ